MDAVPTVLICRDAIYRVRIVSMSPLRGEHGTRPHLNQPSASAKYSA